MGSNVKVNYARGLIVRTPQTCFTLDPTSKKIPSSTVIISHAHLDHTPGFHTANLKIATQPTIKIYETRSQRQIWNVQPLRIGGSKRIKDTTITFQSSGHTLGSTQTIIKTKDHKIVYTGDLNLHTSLSIPQAKPIPCDTLIIEATFGDPRYIFPSRTELYIQIAEWVSNTLAENKVPLFSCYPLGKAQELTAILNRYVTAPVITHPSIQQINELQNRFSTPVKSVDINTDKAKSQLEEGNAVILMPTRWDSALQKTHPYFSNVTRPIASAVATGWCLLRHFNNIDAAFPLSGHADYKQLLAYVDEAKPKRVYTIHGYTKKLARELKNNLGVKASPLIHPGQITLDEIE